MEDVNKEAGREQIAVCEQRIKALNEKEDPERSEAEGRTKKRKKALWAVLTVLAVLAVLAVLLPLVILPGMRYAKATALYNAGEYERAIEAFEAMRGYRDSAQRASEIYEQYKDAGLRNAAVGDYVLFGAYEQDNDPSNGAEDIEWLVLEKDGDSMLLISRYALDCRPYQGVFGEITWEECALRAWLNEIFFNDAFSAYEQSRILNTRVSADENPSYTTTLVGNDTEDRVFLLSITEAVRYMDPESARQCEPTAYANAQSGLENICVANGYCLWWLRSPGIRSMNIAFVDSTGSISLHGYSADHANTAVRPVIRVCVGGS